MITRILNSIIHRIRQTSLLIVVMFVISCLLYTSYFFKNIGNQVKSGFTKNVNSLVALNNNLTLGRQDFDINTVQRATEEYYSDLNNIKNEFNPKYIDINLRMNGKLIKAYGDVYGLTFNSNPSEVKEANTNGDYFNIFDISAFDEYKEGRLDYYSPFPLYSCQNSDFSIIHYKYNYYTYQEGEEIIVNYSKIKKGRTFNDRELEKGSLVCVITPNTYQYVDGKIKKVNVGDYISYSIMETSNGNIEIYKTYDLKVIGILNDDIHYTPKGTSFSQGAIIPEKLFLEMYMEANQVDKDEAYYLFMPVIATLSDFKDMEKFINYMQDLNTIQGKSIDYETSLDTYYSFAGHIEAISYNTSFLFKFALIATIFLYILIINLDLNRRRKEIGLLSSLGQSKTSIMLELILQYLIISIIALIFAVVVSILINKYLVAIFENMDFISSFNVEDKILDYTDGINTINNLRINIDNIQILKISGIEIITIILSTIISVLSIFTIKVREVMIDE